MYIDADEIYAATKLSTSVVPEASVNNFIKAAEKFIDRFTFTTYWKVEQDSQEVSSSTSTVITVAATPYTADALIGQYVWVYDGTAIGQMRKIIDNSSNTITVDEAFDTTPDNGDLFRVIYTATDPRFSSVEDGNGFKYFFLEQYPLRLLNTLSIDGDTVTTSTLYRYDSIGKIQLSETSEKQKFTDWKPQTVDLDYWYGVYPFPEEVKRAIIVLASMYTLAAQTGGTFNVPSTYSLPEGSVTIGQAYVNIRETYNMLGQEWKALMGNPDMGIPSILTRYPKIV
jgi:hypothetical protein